jgi:hypothetical protein
VAVLGILGLVRTYDAFGGRVYARGHTAGNFAAITRDLHRHPLVRKWGVLHVPTGGELLTRLSETRAVEMLYLLDTAYREEWDLPRVERATGVELLNLTEWGLFSDLIDDCADHVHALWRTA